MGFVPPKFPYSPCPPYATQRRSAPIFTPPSKWSDRTNLIGAAIILCGLYAALAYWWMA